MKLEDSQIEKLSMEIYRHAMFERRFSDGLFGYIRFIPNYQGGGWSPDILESTKNITRDKVSAVVKDLYRRVKQRKENEITPEDMVRSSAGLPPIPKNITVEPYEFWQEFDVYMNGNAYIKTMLEPAIQRLKGGPSYRKSDFSINGHLKAFEMLREEAPLTELFFVFLPIQGGNRMPTMEDVGIWNVEELVIESMSTGN